MRIKKNGAIISVIVLLLCVAVYLNWSYSRGLDSEEEAANGEIEAVTGTDKDRFNETQWMIMDDDRASGELMEKYTVMNERLSQHSAYFDETRLDRQTTRDAELGLLRETIASDGASEDSKTSATEKLSAVTAYAVMESRIESLVIAKGFLECVTFISDNGVQVVVLPAEAGLQASDVAKIKDIVISETKITADAIRIIESV